MNSSTPLHNTPAGTARVYWDSETEGHHNFHIRNIALFIRDTDEHLAVSAEGADAIDSGIREHLSESGRLHLIGHWSGNRGQFDEMRKIRRFIDGFGRPCKIVVVTICDFQWAVFASALNPFRRRYSSRITGNYYRARALCEKDFSPAYRLKYLVTRLGFTAWSLALPPGTHIGSLVKRNVEHYNRLPLLEDRFRHVRDFCITSASPCPPPEPGERDHHTVCMVGAHAPRKGSLFALKAILAHYSLEKPLKVILAGRLRGEPELYDLVKASSERISIEVLDRFVSDEELADVFAESDLCLMPYIQFYSSSGVITLSTIHRRPVLASDIGQVASDIREYGLGRLFPELDGERMVGVMEEMLESGAATDEAARDRYLEDCSPAGHMLTLRAL